MLNLQLVAPEEELLIITEKGVIIRQKIDNIRETGRVAQGVRLIRLGEGDKVAAVAKILQGDEEGDIEPSKTES